MSKRSPRATAHLRNAITAAREQAELAYRFAPNKYTYSAFLAARRAEALTAKKKRARAACAPVSHPATHDVKLPSATCGDRAAHRG